MGFYISSKKKKPSLEYLKWKRRAVDITLISIFENYQFELRGRILSLLSGDVFIFFSFIDTYVCVWWYAAAPVTLFYTIIVCILFYFEKKKSNFHFWFGNLLCLFVVCLQTTKTVIIKTWGCFRAESPVERKLLGRRNVLWHLFAGRKKK